MKNGIFYDYGNGQADLIIEKLKEANIMDTIIWIDNTELFELNCKKENRTPLRMPDYDWFDLREAKLKDYQYSGVFNEQMENFYKHFYDFLLKAGREDIKAHANLYRSESSHLYTNSSIFALQNIFFMLCDFFMNMLKSNSIEVIYFNNIPHDGADFVLYLIAKELNIKTVIATPSSIFPNQFFYSFNIEEFGNFDILPEIGLKTPYIIKKESIDKLPYLALNKEFILEDNILDPYIKERFFKQQIKVDFKRLRKSIRRKIKTFFCEQPLNNSLKNIKELCLFVSNAMTYLNFIKYKENLDANTYHDYDLNNKFIYFPLHMQPEATTSAFASVFCDQLLVLEKISNLIPEGWVIYIKEHYPQREYMRDPVFYERLKGIKNVKMLPKMLSSFDLIEKSQFVATITGTVGWEALTVSKNVLVFGRAWYINLPGVFKYNNGFKIKDIINYKIDISELEVRAEEMKSKMGEGIIDCDFKLFVKECNQDENIKVIVESLGKILV